MNKLDRIIKESVEKVIREAENHYGWDEEVDGKNFLTKLERAQQFDFDGQTEEELKGEDTPYYDVVYEYHEAMETARSQGYEDGYKDGHNLDTHHGSYNPSYKNKDVREAYINAYHKGFNDGDNDN